ncbi:uncharacterized protein LOC128869860 [Anastrepha ludens]|uniref:uncharacterized protein LOC128869860 n=1 Tax=Anastrepha ludens TaxID=28586 RepID=UPI0023AEAE70|nr:uncharacterized protein LOC128869860 [Anastrepha ludens]
MGLKVVQINLQHSQCATDNLTVLLAEEDVDIALIQEPWVRSTEDVTAVEVEATDGVTIALASINMAHERPTPPEEARKLVQENPNKTLLLGSDANARHAPWGSPETNDRVNYHENLNNSKGTIFAPCLNNVDEKGIIENMSAQSVTDVYKFSKLENCVSQYTGTVLLTFNLFKLPEKVEVSWHIAKVKPYYPNPMRCKTCQLLGHTAKRCNNAPCQSCNFPPHPPPCSRIYCANCAGDHPSSSKSCPKYMQSKEILKIKCQNKCSMCEALKLYKEQTPTTLSASFAAVVSESQNLSKIEQSKTKPPATLAPSPSCKSPSTASLNAHSDTLIQPNSTSSNTTT